MIEAWLSSSEKSTVSAVADDADHAAFAFQHETYVVAAAVPTQSASALLQLEVRGERAADEPHGRGAGAVPAQPSMPASTTAGSAARPR